MTEKKSPTEALKRRVTDQGGDIYDERELFNEYARFGGMPMLAGVGLEIDRVTAALDGVYSAAVVNEILEREKRKGRRTITDPILLRKIIMFLADNIMSCRSYLIMLVPLCFFRYACPLLLFLY